jgi:hypothetical protein
MPCISYPAAAAAGREWSAATGMDGWLAGLLAREDGRMKAGFKKQEAEELKEELRSRGWGWGCAARREND